MGVVMLVVCGLWIGVKIRMCVVFLCCELGCIIIYWNIFVKFLFIVWMIGVRCGLIGGVGGLGVC